MRLGGDSKNGDFWAVPGAMVMVPALNLWKLQLAGTGGLVYALGSQDVTAADGTSSSQGVSALMLGAGGYADLVLGRWLAIGGGVEYWMAMDDVPNAPDGLNVLFRYGFAF